jgi:glycosyltransferase involved in cell wall biosynthesis
MKLSLCITHLNRTNLLKDCYPDVLDIVSEVVIQDDKSNPFEQALLADHFAGPKTKIYFNSENIGMSRNKAECISNASNDWVVIFDSDNIIQKDYIENIPSKLDKRTIYCPDMAMPEFDYRKYTGVTIDRKNIHRFIKDREFECLMNTCNYVVHRDEYLKVYRYNKDMKGTDSIWMFYLWLAAGNRFEVVPNMRYFHRVHAGSGFLADMKYNMDQAKKVKLLIENL